MRIIAEHNPEFKGKQKLPHGQMRKKRIVLGNL